MVHGPQLERTHAPGPPARRGAGDLRSTEALLEERVKEAPARRRGNFPPRARAKLSAGVAVPPVGEKAGLDQADLLSLLAHQLLTPLALIDTAAQRMARRAGEMEAEEIEARAKRIRAATARLSALSQGLIGRAKLGSGPALNLQPCRIGDLLSRTRDYVHCFQPTRELLVGAPPAADGFAADPLLLEQALMVLVCNALKYSPQDSAIEVSGRRAGAHLELSVKDHGIGIPAEDLPRIFDPFFRSTNAGGFAGSGLGLNLADRIVRLHGGRIDVESQVGRGSTFTIRLSV